jgi:hypothetical protein
MDWLPMMRMSRSPEIRATVRELGQIHDAKGRGWHLLLHPDGATEARSPYGRHVLDSHAPPDPATRPDPDTSY